MTNTYDEYADKAAASYLQGRMDEQGAWVEAVKAQRDRCRTAARSAERRVDWLFNSWDAHADGRVKLAQRTVYAYTARAAALDALLRRMGAE